MNIELEFLIELIKNASKLITDEFEVKNKDEKGDLVTSLDYEIERYIINEIKKQYPNFNIISEEYNSKEKLAKNCFIIDPIDGTINFVNNIPLWGIQIACIKNNKTCAALIYLPKLNELYYASEQGAYLNGQLISVNNQKKGLYTIEGHDEVAINKIDSNFRCFHSSAVGFAYVATGRLCAIKVLCDTLWDYLPGQYIVEKAGGVIYNDGNIHIAANNEENLKRLFY